MYHKFGQKKELQKYYLGQLSLSSRMLSVRCPKQHWSYSKKKKTLSCCFQKQKTKQKTKQKNLQIAHMVKRVSNKVTNSKNYGRMQAAGGWQDFCLLAQNGRQTGKG